MTTLKTGAAIAAAAAAMFTMGGFVTPAHAAEGSVKCAGINSCKGTSECKSATNSCKGMNSCSGQGWVSKKDEAECKAAGGKVL
jgi:uncharacterized membrane protein